MKQYYHTCSGVNWGWAMGAAAPPPLPQGNGLIKKKIVKK